MSAYQKMRDLTNPCRRGQSDSDSDRESEPQHSYEEFMGESVSCPTCKGLGRVPKADEAKLVALIPYNDKRLKPRRTKLYVSLAVGICLFVTFLLVFFLIPREIKLFSHQPKIQPYFATVTNHTVVLDFKYEFNVSNSNYFTINLENVKTIISFQDNEVATAKLNTTTIRLREGSEDVSVPVNVTLDDRHYKYIRVLCSWGPYESSLGMKFETTAVASYLLHTEQVSLSTFQAVNCSQTNPKSNSDILDNLVFGADNFHLH